MKNDPSWKQCEDLWKSLAKQQGCKIFKTGIGSDYLKICPDKKPTFVEVKDGCHDISKTQKATRDFVKKIGFNYEVKRCNCNSEGRKWQL